MRHFVLLGGAAGLVFSTQAFAIPSLTPHPHGNPFVTWGDITGVNLHQHRDTDDLTGGNGKYIGYSCWDNNQYRNGGQWGHGYMASPAIYKFAAAFPALGRTDFNSAEVKWETVTNGAGVNTNGVPITIKMDFDNNQAAVAPEIDVFWQDITTATAFWDPAATDFTFDSAPTYKLNAAPGDSIRIKGSGNPFAASIDVPLAWYFGGTGTPPTDTTNIEIKDNGTGQIDDGTSDAQEYDFYTIALHELGHGFGLAHFGTGIMRTDISSFVMRDPDAGAIDGMKDIYAIPLPEPVSMGGMILSMLALRRRR